MPRMILPSSINWGPDMLPSVFFLFAKVKDIISSLTFLQYFFSIRNIVVQLTEKHFRDHFLLVKPSICCFPSSISRSLQVGGSALS